MKIFGLIYTITAVFPFVILSVATAKGKLTTKILTMGGVLSWTKRMAGTAEEEEFTFPDTLEGFGYYFNAEGKLRSIEGDKQFEFNVREDFQYNQKHYNALGDVITEKIYDLMCDQHQLKKAHLPSDAEEEEPTSFVFITDDVFTNEEKLLVLVHGSGAVRAGQWARRLIINDCLDSGTQLPYIKWGRENGYSVVVANTNLNTVEGKGRNKSHVKIRGNGSPEEHTESLWQEFVQGSPAKHVAIVAHSYGGVCALELAKKHISEFQERVFAVALTDSVHGLRQQEAEAEVKDFYKQWVLNWASAYDPLDTPLQSSPEDCPSVSAGTDKHENTSYASMHSIFKYFSEKYEERVRPSGRPLSLSEPVSFRSPVSSESQNLMARETGEGQEDQIATQETEEMSKTDDKSEGERLNDASGRTKDSDKGEDRMLVDLSDAKTEVKSEL